MVTWAYVEGFSGRILYRGLIALGQDQYGLVSVIGEQSREKAKAALIEGLSRVLKDISDVTEYLSGKMDPKFASMQRVITPTR